MPNAADDGLLHTLADIPGLVQPSGTASAITGTPGPAYSPGLRLSRGWDAIVIGEYERAFYGGQYASMAPLFEHYGISLWTPEVGRVDFHAEDHEQTMLALGFQAMVRAVLASPG